ncbi:MAG TPA: hypothetical protein VGN60_08965 [Devosia sp.]|jgi:hypothetical protein|nr:hypothetical protein [Devosia sp.]
MADPLTNEQIATEIGAIEADLSVILQFMRQLADQRYVVEPEGMEVIEGMVFATSLRVSRLGQAVTARLKELLDVAKAAERFVEATEEDAAEIHEMTILLRRAATFLHSPKDRKEADDALRMMRQGLGAIEQRTIAMGAETPSPDNVVHLFAQRAPAPIAPEGGAA